MLKELFYKIFRIKQQFCFDPFIYVDNEGNCLDQIVGNRVQWLNKVTVKTFSEKRAAEIAFDTLNKQYPQFKNKILLF